MVPSSQNVRAPHIDSVPKVLNCWVTITVSQAEVHAQKLPYDADRIQSPLRETWPAVKY